MTYRFRYTVWECFYFAVSETFRSIVRLKFVRIFLGVMMVLAILPDILIAVMMGEPISSGIMWSLIPAITGMIGFLFFISVIVLIVFLRQEYSCEHSVWVKNGVCYSKTQKQSEPVEFPCENIISVKKSGPFIMLELPFAKMISTYVLIPSRVFSSQDERDAFLEYLHGQQEVKTVTGQDEGDREPAGVWRIEYEVDQNLLAWAYAQDEAIGRTRIFGLTWRYCFPFLILLMILGSGFTMILSENMVDAGATYGLVIPVVLGFFLYIRFGQVKEKDMHRRVAWGIARVDVTGSWRVSFHDRGVHFTAPLSGGFLGWNEIKYLVESDDLLFFYTAKGISQLFFRKILLGKEPAVQEFIIYCRDHGLEHKRVIPNVKKQGPNDKMRML